MINLRPADFYKDVQDLFDWRNDPETRANSVNTDEVTWDSHCAWLKDSLANVRREILIALEDGQAIGTVRVDYGPEAELSWTVAPNARGHGVGKEMVQRAPVPRGKPTVAKIKSSNIASQKIALAAGFTFVKELDDGKLQLWRKRAA